jgi:ribosomal protein L23
MLKPVFTEKSLKMAKEGMYTFWADATSTKISLKAELARIFKVHVVAVNTVKTGSETGRTVRGRKFFKATVKKAIFTLKDGEKIDVFEETKAK